MNVEKSSMKEKILFQSIGYEKELRENVHPVIENFRLNH